MTDQVSPLHWWAVRYLDMTPKNVMQVSILLAAGASLAMSIFLYFSGEEVFDRLNGIYVGVWVPSILAFGAFFLAGQRDK